MSTNIHLRPTQASICPTPLSVCKVLFSIFDLPVKTDFSWAEAHLLLYSYEDNNDPLSDNDCANKTIPLSQVKNHSLQLPILLFDADSEEKNAKELQKNKVETIRSDMCADLANAIKSSVSRKQGYFALHIQSSLIDPSVKWFTLNMALKRNDGCEKVDTLLIRSNPVRIVKHKLSIQLNIRSAASNITQMGNSQTFEFFHAYGGENRPIDVWIHLRDSMGRIVQKYHKPVHLKTSLVYEDGTSVPPGFKGKAYTTKKDKPNLGIYRRLRPDPVLDGTSDTASAFFSFRIEEVSFRHDPHSGFKLHVVPYDQDGNILHDIAPGTMEEVIVVKCRPTKSIKSDAVLSGSKIGGRRTVMQKALGGVPVVLNQSTTSIQKQSAMKQESSAVLSKRSLWLEKEDSFETPKTKRPNLDTDTNTFSSSLSICESYSSEVISSGLFVKYDNAKDSLLMNDSALEALFVGTNNDDNRCLFCNAMIPRGYGLRPLDHEIECRGSLAMAPYIRKEPS